MTLENKLGLTNPSELAYEEEKKSAKRKRLKYLKTVYQIKCHLAHLLHCKQSISIFFWRSTALPGNCALLTLPKAIFVLPRFAPLIYLEAALANIDKMPPSSFD